MARVGGGDEVGFAGERGPRWISGPWFLRGERLYLIPGDSPMGWRLPLDALPWASAGDRPFLLEGGEKLLALGSRLGKFLFMPMFKLKDPVPIMMLRPAFP